MSKTRSLIVVAVALAWAAPAWAQQPTLTLEPLQANQRQLSLEDIDPATQVAVRLRWSATHNPLVAYNYEVTYEAADLETADKPTVVVEDVDTADDPSGSSVSGQTYTIYMLPSRMIPESADPARGGAGQDKTDYQIVVNVFRAGSPFDTTTNANAVWQFQYDTLAPAAPTLTSTVPGEDRVLVQWGAPTERSDDVFQYQVIYCPLVTTASVAVDEGVRLSTLPCPASEQRTATAGKTVTELFIEDGLTNGLPAAVGVRAVDEFGNVGPLSEVFVAIPKDVTDFFELYRQQGGQEDGGFCFVATAAYGSYAHPVVRVLRAFRDGVLGASALGRTLTWAYYQASPPVAAALGGAPAAAQVARALLVGIGVAAGVVMMLPLLALGLLGARLLRRRRAVAVAAGVLGAALLAAAPAQAERPKSDLGALGLAFEFKGGPYLPAMGNATGANEAFVRVFGSNPNPMFRFGAEVQLYRGVGTLGVGGSIGYLRFSGKGLFSEGGEASQDSTGLNVLPLTLVAVYRFDYLAEHTWFPLVPYVKGGLAYSVWWATNGKGNVSRVEGGAPDGGDLVARGGKFGLTGTLGLSLLLNTLEPKAAHSLFNATSIRGTYLFAELQADKVDSFSDEGFDLSDVTWYAGLMLEF
jgi:hypothetical protein